MVNLTHLSRVKQPFDLPRLEILAGFASIWDLLESEIANVVVKKNATEYSRIEISSK